jgi:hypothetical protein
MYFVAVRFSDEKIARLFDLARLILEPDFARPSHITLRGPYGSKSNISDSIIGKDVGRIIVKRPGHFFDEGQNTVFLGIEIIGIADFWYKPDFPNGTPHLTIYDGNDRQLAWVIFRTLCSSKWGLFLNSSPMHVLNSKRLMETDFLFQSGTYRDTFRLIGEPFPSAERLKSLSSLERIVLLSRICSAIHSLSYSARLPTTRRVPRKLGPEQA